MRALREGSISKHLDRYALGTSLRAAIVVPAVFAFALEGLDNAAMAPFAFFGALALLTFVDFGGSRSERLLAYLATIAAGTALVTLGTLCSSSAALATAAMAVVGFAILFAGVFSAYVAAASRAATLSFVLPVMIPLAQEDLPDRLAGWLLGTGVAFAALALPWPKPRRDRLRELVAAAIRSLAETVAASASAGRATFRRRREQTRLAVRRMDHAYLGEPSRPTGVGGRTAALGDLIDDLLWLEWLPPPAPAGQNGDDEVRATAMSALRTSANLLEDRNGPEPDLAALARARDDTCAGFERRAAAWRGGPDVSLASALTQALRLRMFAFACWQLAGDALRAAGRAPPDGEVGAASRAAIRELATAHATMRSVWLRNSIRGALGLSIAVLVGHLAEVQHAFWIVLGTLAVLRSQAVATGVTFLQEIAGTVVGIVAGGLLVIAVGTDTAVLWAIFPFVALIANYARKAVSFPAGQAGFSFQLLIVFNLLQATGWSVGLVRVEDVAIGATISLVTATLLWPRGAASVLRDDLADAYRTAADLLTAVVHGLLRGDSDERLEQRSLDAVAAGWRLDASVRQYLSERSRHLSYEDLGALAAGVTRLRRASDELRDGRRPPRPATSSPALRAERQALERDLDELHDWYSGLGDAIRARARPARPPSPTATSLADLGAVADGGSGADDLPAQLTVAWAHEHLAPLRLIGPRLAAACADLAREDR